MDSVYKHTGSSKLITLDTLKELILRKDKMNRKVHEESVLFLSLGLCISLLLAIGAFEWQFSGDSGLINLSSDDNVFEEIIEIPPTHQPPPPPPKASFVQILEIPDEIEIVEEMKIDLDIEITEEMAIKEIEISETIVEEIEEQAGTTRRIIRILPIYQ